MSFQGVSEVYILTAVLYRVELPDLNQDYVSCGSVWLHLYAAVDYKSKSRDSFLQFEDKIQCNFSFGKLLHSRTK